MRNVAGTRHSLRNTRRVTILAQDPSITLHGKLVRSQIEIPAEQLLPGPCGYRVNDIDYDATTNTLYQQLDLASALFSDDDPYVNATDDALLADPRFHAQNVYAIAMRILTRFEFALGRRVPWGCAGHQLHIAPHAAADPNAFYSREDRALFFGYFRALITGKETTVFTCLSHDIVAHETTHAILDGLRAGLLEPSLPDQAAFHEGFADVVALLSIFALPEIVGAMITDEADGRLIAVGRLTPEHLRESAVDIIERKRAVPLFPDHVREKVGGNFPIDARWLIYRARAMRGKQMLRLVRMLDDAMNNTSLILMLRMGNRVLLFPGDAQIENWSYSLSQPEVLAKLAEVDLYKVGHHGSLNATPKSLWSNFKKKSDDLLAQGRLRTLMSTLEHKHGSVEMKTEVPREALVAMMKKESELFTTQSMRGAFWHDTLMTT